MMQLTYDPEQAVAALCRADRRLARVVRRAGPFTLRPQPLQSPFEALLRAIVYQQLSGRAAATIYDRVRTLFPRGKPTPQRLLQFDDTVLRAAGMSRAKVAAVRDLAAKTVARQVPTLAALGHMSDDEVVARLVQVRGIGRWTVEMLLMFRLGRPDILPVDDLGVRKGFRLVYGGEELPKPDEIHRRGERWRPYRSVACWYLWRAVELLDPPASVPRPRRSNVLP